MSQLFNPKANYIFRAVIIGGILLLVIASAAALYFVQRSSYASQVGMVVNQKVPFSHEHHVKGLGIDCRFCHTSVEKSPFAGMPASETCMKCHRIIWNDSPMLEPVRESYRTGKPLVWERVYDVPDFVYFDHSIHVQKGIPCETCHGKVEDMPLMVKQTSLHMGWCLGCHKHPGNYERFTKPDGSVSISASIATEELKKLQPLEIERVRSKEIQNCSVCHR